MIEGSTFPRLLQTVKYSSLFIYNPTWLKCVSLVPVWLEEHHNRVDYLESIAGSPTSVNPQSLPIAFRICSICSAVGV
jgi:hypothetical protein